MKVILITGAASGLGWAMAKSWFDAGHSLVMADVNDPDLQLQVRHFNESGPLFDNYKNGSSTSEEALTLMIRQREQARQQESN